MVTVWGQWRTTSSSTWRSLTSWWWWSACHRRWLEMWQRRGTWAVSCARSSNTSMWVAWLPWSFIYCCYSYQANLHNVAMVPASLSYDTFTHQCKHMVYTKHVMQHCSFVKHNYTDLSCMFVTTQNKSGSELQDCAVFKLCGRIVKMTKAVLFVYA